ncbi:MAG: hypothetical protein CMJ64_24285 [Planctomycetaceae bacterium]|nr:hypothetical protein [Planctomycetaceae bacterium]
MAMLAVAMLRLSTKPAISRRLRWFSVCATITLLLVLVAASGWIRLVEFYRLSPHLATNQLELSLGFWIAGGGLVLLTACCISYRLVSSHPHNPVSLVWRKHRCLHENRLVFGVLVICAIDGMFSTGHDIGDWK